jgi:hypothetical protein
MSALLGAILIAGMHYVQTGLWFQCLEKLKQRIPGLIEPAARHVM